VYPEQSTNETRSGTTTIPTESGIMGSDASILIHEVLVAMKAADGKIDSINKTIHIHPALFEVDQR
jgi:hypothetical protein